MGEVTAGVGVGGCSPIAVAEDGIDGGEEKVDG